MAVPPAKATMNLEGMPELEDGGPEESIEEYLADVPPIREPLAQPWVRFKAQVCQNEFQHWPPCSPGCGLCILAGKRVEGGRMMSDASMLRYIDQPGRVTIEV